jgi:CDP-diacylglycerol--serine O-phosphatidyltransferase
VCGFAAVVFAAKASYSGEQFSYHKLQIPYFAIASYMILLGMIADLLDGRLARMSKTTSSFGGQLDSLCDVISFGVAPAFLMLKVLEHEFATTVALAGISNFLWQRFIWLAAAAYIICAAIRLARFNVENEEDESAHMSFVGLPSPAAAGVIVSLVIFHQEKVLLFNTVIYALPFLTLAVAMLMVSRIRYPHLINQYIRGKKPFTYLIRAVLLLALVIWSIEAALVLIFCGFAASSFVKWLYHKIIRKRSYLALAAESTDERALTASENLDQLAAQKYKIQNTEGGSLP